MTMPKDPQKAKEYKKLLSQKNKGRVFSKEHRQKLREAKLKNPTRYWLGKKRIYISQKGTTEWYKKNKRDYNLKSWKEANKIKRTQGLEKIAGRPKPKKCEICNVEGRICFDHDHKTGKFRGWICESCNVLLGFAKDDTKKLKLLIKYLEKFSTLND